MAFQKGKSGNPKGRPRGTTEATKLRKMIAEHGEELIDVVVTQAKSGDMAAVKILLDRICPVLKSQSLPAKIPVSGETLTDQGKQILDFMAAGNLGTDEASGLLSALGNLARLQEVDELTRRIEALEKKS